VRRLRQKISRLNIRIRELSGSDIVCTTSTDEDDVNDVSIVDSSSSSDDDVVNGSKTVRRRPKNLSYKKKAGQEAVVADKVADRKYKFRKLKEFEDAVDKVFNNAISKPGSAEGDSPGTAASRGREENALKWVLGRLLTKKPELWAHLLREKRTIQEAEEAAMATIRKHWLDKGLGLFSRCNTTHKAWQPVINLTSHK
jgi:hypothetical protein